MNGFYSLHESQRLCSIPTSIQKSLREKIKTSDFLVADDKGVHRLVGLKYDLKTMNAPIVTCVCMRHEMPAAKQIAFELGKKIFCDSKVSSRIFNLKVGEEVLFLDLNDYVPLAKMYADFLGENHSLFNAVSGNGIQIHRNGVIYIKGQALPARPKLSDLSEILGEPDKKFVNEFNHAKIFSWIDWGLYATSNSNKGKYVLGMEVVVREKSRCCPHWLPLPSIAAIDLCGTPIEKAGPFLFVKGSGKSFKGIWTMDENFEYVSDPSKRNEIAVLHFEFGRSDNGK